MAHVEVHYRSIQANPLRGIIEPHHTRAVFESVDAALSQLDHDVNDLGLDPIGIFRHRPKHVEEHWDGTADGKRYDPEDWADLLLLDADAIREAVARKD